MNASARRFDLAVPVNDDDHVLGPRDAPVAIVEYGDFECAACAQAAPGLQIVRQRFDAGACLVFRHFPLADGHPHAMLAAEAAAAQGRFWPMHDVLFRHELHLGRERLLHCARVSARPRAFRARA